MTIRTGSRIDSASSAKAMPCARPLPSFALSPSATLRLNIGMNAAENAPSAKRARNRLGKRNAIMNASDAKPAPTKRKNSESRTSPSTRLVSVSPPTEPSALAWPTSPTEKAPFCSACAR
ncbi:hypothetical protein WR25_00432 [Diploscapter pachys]|uniref:Uncharacterized protein n=1 Tax=Diploscapter pachys TaxID=2018661 RepID=A0A2A2M583_9BILA|nr:hypothetical protein WR25_00432 [Diploscapter pachys]